MIVEFKLDKITGHAKEGRVGQIYKTVNEPIKNGEPFCDIESNKGNATIFSNVEGQVKSIEIETGDKIKIGDVLAKIDGEDVKETTKKERNNGSKKSGAFNYMGNLMKPKKETLESEIAIIGAGPGGYVAAIHAAKLGKKVVLIEKDNLGGTCLNWGCIPTKALVRSAEVYSNLKTSEEYGIIASEPTLHLDKVMARKNNIVSELVGGVDYLIKKNNITFIKGKAEILNKDRVYVKNGNKETTIETKNIILATGATPSKLPIKGMASKHVITSKGLLDIKELPKSLIIVGGGVIGMEFAFIFKEFDVEVTVIEYANHILPALDEDISSEILQAAEDKGIKIITKARVEEIIDTEDDHALVAYMKNAKNQYVVGDKILMSVGRQPNIEGFDFEKLGIGLNDKERGIEVNDHMETTVKGIYAIGDVTDKIQLAHVASHQGIVAVDHIAGKDKAMDYSVIPSAIFTHPEIAVVGLNEKEAKEKGIKIEVGKFPFAANGKALTLGETRGFVKVIAEKATNRLLGGAIIGPHATDLIHELTLAIKNKLTVEQLTETIHAHPTTSEAIHEATLDATEYGAIHFMK